MFLNRIVLQHFRSYQQKTFDFDQQTALIVGKNTAGKTNLVEAIYLLSFGKSFRADKDIQMISFGDEISRVQGLVLNPNNQIPITNNKMKLEVMLACGEM